MAGIAPSASTGITAGIVASTTAAGMAGASDPAQPAEAGQATSGYSDAPTTTTHPLAMRLGGPAVEGTELARIGTVLERLGTSLATRFHRWTGGIFADNAVALTPDQIAFLRRAVRGRESWWPFSIPRRNLNALDYALQHDVGSITKDPRLLASAITFLDTPAIYRSERLGNVQIPNSYRGEPMANQTLAALRQAQSRLSGTVQTPPPSPPELVEVSVDQQCKEILGKWYVLLTYDQYQRLEDGVALTSIFGEKVVVGRDSIDMETRGRMNFLAYGIPLEELRGSPVPGSTMHVAITDGVARPVYALPSNSLK